MQTECWWIYPYKASKVGIPKDPHTYQDRMAFPYCDVACHREWVFGNIQCRSATYGLEESRERNIQHTLSAGSPQILSLSEPEPQDALIDCATLDSGGSDGLSTGNTVADSWEQAESVVES